MKGQNLFSPCKVLELPRIRQHIKSHNFIKDWLCHVLQFTPALIGHQMVN